MHSEIQFSADGSGQLAFRSGVFKKGARQFSTPAFLPIVNIMTGPPPVLANGGLYRHIKIDLLKENPVPGIMTQILHFTDYNIDARGLGRWLQTPISERIEKETGHRPFLFVDSGGYRLLYNTGLDAERYGIDPSVEGILELQRRFGADVVATLDYPLPRGLQDLEARDRIGRSVENCIKTARVAKRLGDSEQLVYMAVHGRTRVESRDTVRHLLSRMKQEHLTDIPFGLAIGSLVPLSSSPMQVIDIVRGVHEGLTQSEAFEPSKIPVHAFGVSSRMMPYLAAMGVDTFDGTTYVQQAQQLRYSRPGTWSSQFMLDIDELTCRCRYCRTLEHGGLDLAKHILKSKSFGRVNFDGRETNKSYVYSLIALHNLQASLELANRIRNATKSSKILEDLFLQASSDVKMRKTLAYFARFNPKVSDFLWEVGVAKIVTGADRGKLRTRVPRGSTDDAIINNTRSPGTSRAERRVSLALGPSDFDIAATDYEAAPRPVMLILPCSQQKPYSSSPTHRFVRRLLENEGIPAETYSKVSISGNYGPVPEQFERDPRVQSYDFYLSSADTKRIDLIAQRTRNFVEVHKRKFNIVIAYCTSKAYREAVERALEGIAGTMILPEPLRIHRQSQFRKPENARQLVLAMKPFVESV